MVNTVLRVSLWLSLWLVCDCAPLQVAIAGRSGSISCVGDMVTFTCTVPAVAHSWDIPSLVDVSITRQDPTFPRPGDPASPFAITITADEGGVNPILTALSVTSFAGLNGANITCSDANQIEDEAQDATALVFSPPSAPGLTAIPGGDLASFDLTITPSTPPDCVVNYVITATSSDDSRDITVPASEVDGFIPVNVGGFDACTRAYSFTVAPVTSEGTGMRSASVVSDVTPITGLMATPASIEWTAPSGVPETCFPQYIISLTTDSTVSLTVDNTTASSAALNASGFPYCVSQGITVTPIVTVTNAPLTSSSAAMQLVVNDPVIGAVVPNITILSMRSLRATVSWEDDEQSRGRQVRVGSTSGSDCVTTDIITEGISTTVEFQCDSGQVIMSPCVQYFDRECKSMPFTVPVTCPTSSGSSVGSIVGGVIAAVVVIGVLIVVVVIVLVVVKKKKGGDAKSASAKSGKQKGTEMYPSDGATSGSPQTPVTVKEHAPGTMYADPKRIEHETAATGDQYTLLTSDTKAKKNDQPEATPPTELENNTYSVPDKTKKQQNQTQGLVYADIGQPKAAPRNRGSVKQQQQHDTGPVAYSTINNPIDP